jgi:hypothetical protein
LRSDLNAKHRTIGLPRKFSMKTRDCIETPLMAAFRAVTQDRQLVDRILGHSTNGESAAVRAPARAQLSTLRKPRR